MSTQFRIRVNCHWQPDHLKNGLVPNSVAVGMAKTQVDFEPSLLKAIQQYVNPFVTEAKGAGKAACIPPVFFFEPGPNA